MNRLDTLICWTSRFQFRGAGGIFHFFPNLNRSFCNQTVKTPTVDHSYCTSKGDKCDLFPHNRVIYQTLACWSPPRLRMRRLFCVFMFASNRVRVSSVEAHMIFNPRLPGLRLATCLTYGTFMAAEQERLLFWRQIATIFNERLDEDLFWSNQGMNLWTAAIDGEEVWF